MKKLLPVLVVVVALGWFVGARLLKSDNPSAPIPITPTAAPVKPADKPALPPSAPVVTTPAPTPRAVVPPKPADDHPWDAPQMVLAAMLDSNNLYHDDLLGVSATLPEGWKIRDAKRWGQNNRENTVWMTPDPPTSASPSMYYQMYPEGKPAPEQTEAYLRNIAAWKENSRIQNGIADYKNVPESFAFTEVDGHPSLSYFATFTHGDQVMTEYFVRVLGQKGYVMFFTMGKLEDVKAIMPQVKQMATSVKVP